ncbi:MAG: hypothetical protein ACRDT1_12300 [Micromonosporaceae bacterium]
MYASLSVALAGFAFAGLVLYLSRQDSRSGAAAQPAAAGGAVAGQPGSGARERYVHISPHAISKTLLYAMSALIICAFLYGRLAGEWEAESSGLVLLTLVAYGVILGLSVLSLFYAMCLLMLTHQVTRRAAEDTRWVVAAMGPGVVMSFLAGVSADAWSAGCRSGCPAWSSPLYWGSFAIVAFVAFGMLLTSMRARRVLLFALLRARIRGGDGDRQGLSGSARGWLKSLQGSSQVQQLARSRPLLWLVMRPWVQRSANVFRQRPDLPAAMTLVLASLVGVSSLWARDASYDFRPHYALVDGIFGLTVLVMGAFAFAAGSVLDEPKDEAEGKLEDERDGPAEPGPGAPAPRQSPDTGVAAAVAERQVRRPPR